VDPTVGGFVVDLALITCYLSDDTITVLSGDEFLAQHSIIPYVVVRIGVVVRDILLRVGFGTSLERMAFLEVNIEREPLQKIQNLLAYLRKNVYRCQNILFLVPPFPRLRLVLAGSFVPCENGLVTLNLHENCGGVVALNELLLHGLCSRHDELHVPVPVLR
jgi:hypothetical protein